MGKGKTTILQCSTRRIQIQNDLREWEIDKQNKPTKVLNEKMWALKNISVDVRDIPKTKVSLEKVTIVKDKDNNDVQVIEKVELEAAVKTATDIEKEKRTRP